LKFTIFGSSGFIGRSLAAYLRGRGYEVQTPMRNNVEFKNDFLGHVIYAIGMTGNFRKLPFDTVDAHVCALKQRLQYASYESWLYLSSTRPYGVGEMGTHETNQIATTPSIDGIYNISKLLGESLCLAIESPKVRVARLSNVYGIGQSQHTFLGAVISKAFSTLRVEIQETRESCKDYISICDVMPLVESIAIEGKERIYNLASGINTTHLELGNEIGRLTGANINYLCNGILRKNSPIDITRIKSEFSYTPTRILVDLERFLKEWQINTSKHIS